MFHPDQTHCKHKTSRKLTEATSSLRHSATLPTIAVPQQVSASANTKNDRGYFPSYSAQPFVASASPPAPKRTSSPLRPVVQESRFIPNTLDNTGLVDVEALQALQRLTDQSSHNASRQPSIAQATANVPDSRRTTICPPDKTSVQRETPPDPPSKPLPRPHEDQFRWNLGDYMLGRTIGAGSMGKVKFGYCKTDGQKVAVKIVPRNTSLNAVKQSRGKSKHSGLPMTEDELEATMNRAKAKDFSKEVRVIREASLQMLLRHPYVCRMREFITHPNHHYMVFEHINGGQMLDYIISHGRLRERSARNFARQIGSALQYCHANNIVHRDLKIENILISKSGNIKIIDFGLSNVFKPQGHLNTFCGSLYFAAPELLNARVYTGPEVDVWSFGVVLYVLVCGKVPFDDQSMPVLHARIKRGLVDYPNWLSADCKHILSRMIDVNPHTRASLNEIVSHPWMLQDHGAPEPAYLPKRKPLTAVSIDPVVIERMTGFEFGSPQEIYHELKKILCSEEYVAAVARHEDPAMASAAIEAVGLVQSAATESVPRGNRLSRQISAGINFYHRHVSRSSSDVQDVSDSRESTPGVKGPLHPCYGFHPLISIYFLVKEKMDREKLGQEIYSSSDLLLSEPGPMPTFNHKPALDVPESAAHDHIDRVSAYGAATFASSLPMARFAPDKSSSIIRPPEKTHVSSRTMSTAVTLPVTPSPPPPSAVMMAPPQPEPQTPVFESRQKSQPQGIMLGPPRPLARVDELESSLRTPPKASFMTTDASQAPSAFQRAAMPQRSVSMMHARHADQLKSLQDRHASMAFSTSGARPLPTLDAIQSEAGKNLLPCVSEAVNSAGTVFADSGPNLTRRFGTMSVRPTHEASDSFVPQQLSPENSHINTMDSNQQSLPFEMPSPLSNEDASKPVFLKGLFSVQTTSRRPRVMIRRDLIRVFEQFKIQFTELKNGFECSYAGPLTDTDTQSAPAEAFTDMTSTPATDSMNDPTPIAATGVGDVPIDRSGQSDVVLATPNSDAPSLRIGVDKPLPCNEEAEVCFEICLVKVPLLLGMNGIQFRRVSGNPWKYQALAKRILNELHL
jgi:serine/threonine protein kinase KIN1/2